MSSAFLSVAVTAIFVQNLVMIYMLCDGEYFKALRSPVAGLLYAICVTFSTTLASVLSWLVNRFLLKPYALDWLAPFAFILVIVLIEFIAEIIVYATKTEDKSSFHKLFAASAFNCAVLGLVFINVRTNSLSVFGTAFYGLCAGVGYLLALFISANAMERVRFSTPPNAFKGLPIALVTASIISLAFMGFSDIVLPY